MVACPLGVNPGASRCSSHEENRDADTVEAAAQGVGTVLPATCCPPRERQERSPSGSSSANAGAGGSSRKCWTGCKSASNADQSLTAPDEGVWAGLRGPARYLEGNGHQ